MDKVTRLIFSIIFVVLCSFQKSLVTPNYNLIFIYDTYTEIDLNKRQIRIHYDYFKNPFPINFSDLEEKKISMYFNKYKIGIINKNVYCIDTMLSVSPSSDFKIRLLQRGKLKSKMTVDFLYKVNRNKRNSEEYRVAMFSNNIIKILESNSDFKKTLKALSKYENENHLLRL